MQEDGLESENPDKMFFDYLSQAYESFLAGHDNDQQLEEELAAQFGLSPARARLLPPPPPFPGKF